MGDIFNYSKKNQDFKSKLVSKITICNSPKTLCQRPDLRTRGNITYAHMIT